jgi:DNA-directed RNA polymerase beta' subunit
VISSNTKPHKYDELDLAWSQAIALLELHLVNKLLKRGMTVNEADGFLRAHTYKHSPMIKELFQEIIREAGGGRGLIGIYVRNPSLTKSSTCMFRVMRIKDDPMDFTNTLPILATVLFNADFDGDAMAFMLMLDNKTARSAENLAIHKSTIEPNKPRTLTPNPSIPKPVASTCLNWLSGNGRSTSFTADELAFAMSLAD